MKKFKNLMLMLALALFFVGAMGMTKASATDASGDQNQTSPSPTAAATKVTEEIKYAEEIIKVTADKQVYYQVVKAAEPGKLKPANWIKAAKNGDGVYYIDFSSVANGKDAYFALTTDNTAETATTVAVVDSVIKSVKVTLNYKAEKLTSAGLADIITTLNVKGVDKGDDNAEGTPAEYSLKWKRGANGYWAEAKEFNQLEWDMLKASNGTLYVAIDGKVANEKTTNFRMSKEAKVKIPKSAKAPTVKVDFVKGTIALKNGMQVRVNNGTVWMDVVAYDKASTEKELVFAKESAEKKTTSKKVSTVSIADFKAAINDKNILNAGANDGDEIAVTVRTAATDKKFPSMEGTMTIVLPKAAPAAKKTDGAVALSYTAADKANKIEAAYTIDFSTLFTLPDKEKYSQYEYMFVADKADGTNLAKQKWTKLPEDGKVDLAKYIGKEYKYFKAADESKSSGVVKYEAIKAVYIRLAAVKETKEVKGVFASDYVKVEVAPAAAAVEYTLTSDAKNAATATFKVGDKDATKAVKDAEVTIVYTPTSGKEIETVTYTVAGNSTPVTVTATNSKYTFKMPAGNVTVTVIEKAAASSGT